MTRFLGVLLLAAFCLHAIPGHAATDTARLTEFVDGAVAEGMRRDHLAGVSVAIVGRDGILMSKSYGVSDLNPPTAMTPDTLTRIGSISKTVVWISLMQLVEQGKIKLSDPINQHLPKSLQIPDEGFAQPIEVWHLMSHTTGFEQSVLGHMVVDDAHRELPLDSYLARYRPHRVLPPGKIVVYSNYGAALAGAIVSQVSGMPWEDFAEQRVMRPLGMRLATFREVIPPELAAERGLPTPMESAAAAHMSRGFRWRNNRLEEAPAEFITHYSPAGALSANANDMAAYMTALLNPDLLAQSGVLSTASFHTLLEPLFANSPGFGTNYHGFGQFPLPGSRMAFGHDGETIYQRAVMIIAPDLGLGIFVATNTAEGTNFVLNLPTLISRHLLGASPPMAASAPAAATSGIQGAPDIEGTYRPLRRAYFRTERALLNLKEVDVKWANHGEIVVSGLADDPTRYAPVEAGVYQELGSANRIAFRLEDGQMLLLNSDGVEPLQRIGFFAGSGWLLLISVLAQIAALGGTIGLLKDIRNRRMALAGGAWHVGAALWLLGFVLAWICIVPWLLDIETLVMQYPGKLFPIACWIFAAAALVTVLLTGAVLVKRPAQWSWQRWIRVATSVVLFIACAVTFRYWGLLGFSGW
jgi:CubicO group peptidase (beta-lactamase class C family)